MQLSVRIAALAAAGFVATLCSGKMKVEFDKAVDFSRYKTYQWFPPRVLKKTGISEDDDVVAPVIRRTVNEQLQKRNLTEVKEGGELKVSTWALSTSIPHVDRLIFPNMTAGVTEPVPDPGVWIGAPPITVGRYNKEGTLVVNLIDAATSKSVWAALITKSYGSHNEIPGKIEKSVAEMFRKYPVKPQ